MSWLMCSWPRTRRKPFSAKSNAAAPHRKTIFPSRHRLTRRVQASVRAKQLSNRLLELNVRPGSSGNPNRVTVNVSSKPSSKPRAAAGLMVSSHFAQARNSFQSFLRRGFGPRPAQTPFMAYWVPSRCRVARRATTGWTGVSVCFVRNVAPGRWNAPHGFGKPGVHRVLDR